MELNATELCIPFDCEIIACIAFCGVLNHDLVYSTTTLPPVA